MKTALVILTLLVVPLGAWPFRAYAAGLDFGMMGSWQNAGSTTRPTDSADINSATQDIYKSQNVGSVNQIDCGKVTDDQFEKLGDAYMGYVHPGQEYNYMEQMMGGEGSDTLRQAHINMGRAYLGCWSGYNSAPIMMPMMGSFGMMFSPSSNSTSGWGMMGRSFGSGWNMMGGYYGGYAWFGWITMILVWTLLILGIAAVVKWLKKS
ncbi:MAG: hypothetical protein Q8N81_06850 [bacterium]|nr:hypothetical protein [bacterium]